MAAEACTVNAAAILSLKPSIYRQRSNVIANIVIATILGQNALSYIREREQATSKNLLIRRRDI